MFFLIIEGRTDLQTILNQLEDDFISVGFTNEEYNTLKTDLGNIKERFRNEINAYINYKKGEITVFEQLMGNI